MLVERVGPLPYLGAAANARRLGSVTSLGAGDSLSLASQSQAPFVALRPALRPVAGVLVPRRPPPRPSLRSPRPPATAHPLVCKSSAPRLRHRVRASPHACGPRAAAAAHHFGSCLAFIASAVSQPLLSSRSQRVRARQGILPVKTLGDEAMRESGNLVRPNF